MTVSSEMSIFERHASRLGSVLSVAQQADGQLREICQILLLPSGSARIVPAVTRADDAIAMCEQIAHQAPWLGIRALELYLKEHVDPTGFEARGFARTFRWIEWQSPEATSCWTTDPALVLKPLTPGDDREFDRVFLESYATTSRTPDELEDDLASVHLVNAVAPDQHAASLVIAAGRPVGILALSFLGEDGELNHIGLLPGRRSWVRTVTETALSTIIGRGCTRIHTLVADWNHRSQRLNEFFHFERRGSQLALRRVLGRRFEIAEG